MRTSLLAVLILLAVPIVNGCRRAYAENPRDVELNLIATQAFDSLGIVVSWTPGDPPGARQYPIAGHNIEVKEQASDTVLASGYVMAGVLVDTLWMAMPPLESRLDFYGAVNAQDTQGSQSDWAISPPMTWITTPLAPNTPGGVSVDTTVGALIIDSMRILNRDGFAVTLGDTTRLAAVLYSGPWPVECCCTAITDPPGTHPCDDVALVSLGSVLPVKRPVYEYVTAVAFRRTGCGPGTLEPRGILQRRWFVDAWRSLQVG